MIWENLGSGFRVIGALGLGLGMGWRFAVSGLR